MNSRAVSYDRMNISSIHGFPNRIPHVDWQTYLPKFKYQKGDDASIHLVRFHKKIHKMGFGWHEDYLMRIFMITLEGDARSWYEGLPLESLQGHGMKGYH